MLGKLQSSQKTIMKIKMLFVIGMFFFVQNISYAQTQEADSTTKATSWQYTKMAYSTYKFLTEANSIGDRKMLNSARQHLKYTEKNLENLEGKLDTTRYKEAKVIFDVLDTAVSKGLTLDMRDNLALSITANKIDKFAKGIYSCQAK